MPKYARYFSAAVIAAAVIAGACVFPDTDWRHASRGPFVVLLGLEVLLMLTIRLPMRRENPAGPALVSVLLAAIILLPPGAAALSGAVGSAFMVLRRGDPFRVAFSAAVTFLSALCAGLTYRAAGGHSVLTSSDFPKALLPIALAVLVLSATPAVLIGFFLVEVGQHSPRVAFREYVLKSGLRNIGYAFVGLLTAVLWSVSYDALAAVVLIGPVVVTRWATVQYEEQRDAHDAIIRTLVQAVEIKDLYTRGHSERVAKISEMIAAELRMPEDRAEVLRYAATLHDVGKLGVPTRLLRKTGRLDDREFEEIRLHPSRGVEVVRDIAFLDEAYSAILHHHERMDGLGYPSGLRGMRIPPFARIIAVADAFDSMTSTRSYRGARGSDEALTELRANMGTQFDPTIVDAIAAALARAELAGHPWRGDGTVYEGEDGGRTQLENLPPGAVVAEFDHDDPAYQHLAVAEAEGREKPGWDEFATGGEEGVDRLGDEESECAETGGFGADATGLGEASNHDGSSGREPTVETEAALELVPEAETEPAPAPEQSGHDSLHVEPEPEPEQRAHQSSNQHSARRPARPPKVPPQSRSTAPGSARDQAAGSRDGLRFAPFGPALSVPSQAKREPDLDPPSVETGAPSPAPPSADPDSEGR
jgi:HD domain